MLIKVTFENVSHWHLGYRNVNIYNSQN